MQIKSLFEVVDSALKSHKVGEVFVTVKDHSASRAEARAGSLTSQEWEIILSRSIAAITTDSYYEYLFFSKEYQQGFIASYSKNDMTIITVLPKSKITAVSGTKRIIVENKEYLLVDIE